MAPVCGHFLHISVEGNISIGKSRFLRELEETCRIKKVEFFTEPVEVWRNFNGKNYLDEMYTDPTANAFKFQMLALSSKLDQLDFYEPVNITERSLDSQKHVFIPALLENGFITEAESDLLQYSIDVCLKRYPRAKPNYYLYLRGTPELSLERIRKRERPEERDVTLEYLEQLHKLHDNWLLSLEDNTVLVYDTQDKSMSSEKVWRNIEETWCHQDDE